MDITEQKFDERAKRRKALLSAAEAILAEDGRTLDEEGAIRISVRGADGDEVVAYVSDLRLEAAAALDAPPAV